MSFLKNIFVKKEKKELFSDFSSVKVDMHSHLIPAVDDGSKSLENSFQLIEGLQAQGFTHFITTPHIMSDIYPNSRDILLKKKDELIAAAQKQGVEFTLEVSAEYFLDQHFLNLIKNNELMPFGDNNILFELSFIEEPPLLKEVIFELQSAGYNPILAHPERYSYFFNTPDELLNLAHNGVRLQANINSFTDHYSPLVRKSVENLVNENAISFLGTDCHHTGHLDLMREARKNPWLKKLIESDILLNSQLV